MKKSFGGLALCLGCALSGAAYADGVTRSVEPVAGGCKVTLAWEFSGKVESDLVIEERLAPGWAVDDATVPFGSLDASWFSGSVARFAVKPALLSQAGSISFTVVPGEGATSGMAKGDWKMYLAGELRKGNVSGTSEMTVPVVAQSGSGTSGNSGNSGTSGSSDNSKASGISETSVAIASFKVSGGVVELSYSGAPRAGTLAVEGCETFGKPWNVLKLVPIAAGDGKIALTQDESGKCRFFRLKLQWEE